MPAQKFLSCVYRVDQRFGAAHIIDILLGSRNEKIKKFNHNFLSTWGIGTELSKQAWFELCDAMQNAGLIERVGEWNIVKVTSLGRELLQNRDKIELPVRIDFGSQKKAELALPKKKAVLHKKAELKDDDATQELFDRLKAWRKKLAEEESRVCPVCGTSLAFIRRKRMAGCPECYAIFKDDIQLILKNQGVQGQYTGSMPNRLRNFRSVLNDRIVLRTKLEESLKKEDYEKAALYRDYLRALEKTRVAGGDQ